MGFIRVARIRGLFLPSRPTLSKLGVGKGSAGLQSSSFVLSEPFRRAGWVQLFGLDAGTIPTAKGSDQTKEQA
jgi:hypothetical protein